MITDALLNMITALIQGLYNLLPAWNIALGGPPAGSGGGIDNGYLLEVFALMEGWDKVLPIHDAFFPCMAATFTISAALYAIGGIKTLVNLIRGAGS